MTKRFITLCTVLFFFGRLFAQHQETSCRPELWKGSAQHPADSNSLLSAFKRGQVHGHFRYFFMATDNAAGLSDYHAHAMGGGIKYESAPIHGFQMGVSGFFFFNVGSSDLTVPDPKTGQYNRYEVGLFDVENPGNRNDIDRLEELYLKYTRKQSQVTFGRQLINTPFINLQDGRMRPTDVGGIYTTIRDIPHTVIEGGWLYEISPRGTVRWFRVQETFGIYSQGVNPDGSKSDYKDHVETNGVALLGITRQIGKQVTVSLHEVFVENIFNTLMLQAEWSKPVTPKGTLKLAGQFTRQDAIHDGGHADPAHTYFTRKGRSEAMSFRLGWEASRWQTSLNYTRITAAGRYLMPREWGREPFFTFLPRERNEGMADVHAYVAKAAYQFPRQRIKTQIGFGYYNLPEVSNYALNKYGMPSYTQLNIDIRYDFAGWLKGFETQLLWVYKNRQGDTYGNDKYVINKVNMSSWNLVVNYHF